MKRKQRATTHFTHLPELGLELLHVTNLTHDYPLHIHEQQCFILVQQGSETTSVDGSAYQALAGHICVLHPEELHSSVSLNVEYRVFKIQADEFRRIVAECFGTPSERLYFSNRLIDDAVVFDLLLKLHRKLEQKDSILQHESEFVSAMEILLTRHHQGVQQKRLLKDERGVQLVRDHLKARYSENISLSQLTSLTELNRFSMLRAFTKKFGISPHEYQIQLRIAHTRELIRRGHSISDAALETGFFDQSHLSRHFKRIVGVTPGEYVSGCNIVQESRE
jgi:AraC-like DNA-binding protein